METLYMDTFLDEKIRKFFEENKGNITIEKIDLAFDDDDINDFGNLLHATIWNKFPESDVFVFIEELLKDDYDVNYQAKRTGYTFIHVALYGYFNGVRSCSYSTKFIVKLIELAKKYGFNVNLKDKDSESIIHAAIASEIYTGKIIPIIKALGPEFDINCVDEMGMTILEALDYYEEEAQKKYAYLNSFEPLYKLEQTKYGRLLKEHAGLKKYFSTALSGSTEKPKNTIATSKSFINSKLLLSKMSKEQLNIKKDEIINRLTLIFNDISFESFAAKSQKILRLKNKLITYENLIRDIDNKTTESSAWDKYNSIIEKIVLENIKIAEESTDIEYLNSFSKILYCFDFEDEYRKIETKIYKLEVIRQKKLQRALIIIENTYTRDKRQGIFESLNEIKNKCSDEEMKKLYNKISEINRKMFALQIEIQDLLSILKNLLFSVKYDNFNKYTLSDLIKIRNYYHKQVLIVLKENKDLVYMKKEDLIGMYSKGYFTDEEMGMIFNGIFSKDETIRNNNARNLNKKNWQYPSSK